MLSRKIAAGAMALIAAVSLASCGNSNQATYTKQDIGSAREKCVDNEDDMTAVATEKNESSLEITAWYNSYDDKAQGIESDLFKCVFNELKVPDRISERMESKQAKQTTDSSGNLYVSWFRDDLQLSVYLGLKKPSNNGAAYYKKQTLKWLSDYCQSAIGDQEILEYKNGALGLDSMNINDEGGSGALACISFQLGFDNDLEREIETIGPQQWNVRFGDYYLGWIHSDSGMTLAVSTTRLE